MTYMKHNTLDHLPMLFSLLGQKRPSGDLRTYQWFKLFMLANLNNSQLLYGDKSHNFWVIIPYTNGMVPKHALTSHYDTVHRQFERNEYFMDEKHVIFTNQGKAGTPLGADDGAGIFIMLQLINRSIPGVYLFFSDEECGGIGSSNFDLSVLPAKLDIMLSLDRAGFDEVVCSQAGVQGASEAFGQYLADKLNLHGAGFKYGISHDGVFTDSAQFVDAIPECANLSVGYFDQHTKYETLHVDHVLKLVDALAAIDFRLAPVGKPKTCKRKFAKQDFWLVGDDDKNIVTDYELLDYVMTHPEKVAAFLEKNMVTVFEIDTDI